MAAINKMGFTQKSIETIIPPKSGRETYSDTGQPGLKLRVTAKGKKTFTLIKKVGGRVRFLALGEFPFMSVHEARRIYQERAAKLMKGEEPETTVKDGLTFGELLDSFIKAKEDVKRTIKQDENAKRLYLGSLLNKRLNAITEPQVKKLFDRWSKENGEATANRVLALVKAVYNFGINKKGFKITNPASNIELNELEERARFLSEDELKRFFNALDSEKTLPLWRDFFYLLLWTGVRRGNLQSMKWADVDFALKEWTIPKIEFKGKRAFIVSLTKESVTILEGRKSEAEGSSPYVFPSWGKSGHITEPKTAWRKLLKDAGISNLKLHDLRRTLASYQVMSGESLEYVRQTLGHRDARTTQIYARFSSDSKRQSMERGIAKMLKDVQNK